MYYNNSYFQHNIPKFCNGSYFNTKNKFFNNIDLSTTMMAVYPDGVVGIISINQPSSSFSYNYTNTKNFNYNFESNLQDSFLHSTLKKSNSNHSIKSEPAYNFKSNEAFKFDKGWKQGDECFAPYINGHYYSARFESYGPADLCVIFFYYFGHHSYVPIGTLYSHF